MKTPEEWYEEYIKSEDSICLLITKIQNNAYNEALKNIDALITNMNAVAHTVTVRNEIQKLKKL